MRLDHAGSNALGLILQTRFALPRMKIDLSGRGSVVSLSHESRARNVVFNKSDACIIFDNSAAERR
jgi:hypothetical protein